MQSIAHSKSIVKCSGEYHRTLKTTMNVNVLGIIFRARTVQDFLFLVIYSWSLSIQINNVMLP